MKRLVVYGAVGAALAFSWVAADIHPSALFDPANLRSVSAFLRGLFPLALAPDFLGVVAAAVVRTLAIAVAGTALSVLFALPLGILGTPSLWRRGPLLQGEGSSALRALLGGASLASRGVLGFLRAVPDLVWALLFVVGFGLGPLPGALALGVNYAGVLGRVYADLFEGVSPGPVLALHAAGASRMQVFAAAIWPQAAPSALAYTLYSFECCVRAAAVLGFVGAGGIGAEINLSMRMFEYGQVTTLLGAFVILVLATDAASRSVRGRFQRNAVHGSGLLRAPVEATPSGARWPAPLGSVLLLAALALSLQQSGFLAAPPAHLASRLLRFAAQLAPPDLEPGFLRGVVEPLRQTVAISLMGTAIGVVLGGALALPATSTLMPWRRDAPDAPLLAARVAALGAYAVARAVLALLRAIPEMVWVLLCILAVGLGPFAGALALGLHTAGVLGKLYAETLEEVDQRPLEELRAAGATRLQRLFFGALPQARETLASYTLLRWETNLRASTVVGLLGGGGLGLALYNAVQLGFYPRAATLVLVICALTAATDALAHRLRRRPADARSVPTSALELLST